VPKCSLRTSLGGADMATVRKRKEASVVQAVAVVRYSTEHQGENSVGRQCEAIERWAARFGVQLVAVFFDYATSRTTEHHARPGLSAAIDSLTKGTVLVAENVSRYAGDAVILGGIRAACTKRGARLATADETGDADLDEDRQDFEALFSKREIKMIRRRTKGALAVKKLRGERLGNVPFGFRRKLDDQHVMRRGVRMCALSCMGCLHIESDEHEQRIIARAKVLSDVGLSVRAIAAALNEEGFRTRKGTPFSHTLVHRFLQPLLIAEAA